MNDLEDVEFRLMEALRDCKDYKDLKQRIEQIYISIRKKKTNNNVNKHVE